jgi:phosphoribosylformylglycinamidine cyclo-ligase
MTKPLTYADAGVDIDKANSLVDSIKKIASQTRRPGVMGDIGGFGGLFSLSLNNLKRPVLVSSTDGVGTKLKIAFALDKHDTIGIDLVAMCVNDIVVQGAKPLFFLDYLSMGKLKTEIAEEIIKGIGDGCQQAQCALIGGETAEMPGFYSGNEYDLAGFAVGVVDDSRIVDGSEIRPGYQLVGIASSGIHSNGFSLVRKICFDLMKLKVEDYVTDLGRTLGEELLTPTRIYARPLMNLLRDLPVRGIAHITGGGIPDNILRVVPDRCQVRIRKGSWDVPPVFNFLQKAGNIEEYEMMRTFNCGIGMIVVVPEDATDDVLQRLVSMGEKAFIIGDIVERKGNLEPIEWIDQDNSCQ